MRPFSKLVCTFVVERVPGMQTVHKPTFHEEPGGPCTRRAQVQAFVALSLETEALSDTLLETRRKVGQQLSRGRASTVDSCS